MINTCLILIKIVLWIFNGINSLHYEVLSLATFLVNSANEHGEPSTLHSQVLHVRQLDVIYQPRKTVFNLHRGQTQEHAQCTRTRSPAAKISRAKI